MAPAEIVDLITRFVSNLGFPIFVAVYLLVYHKRALEDLTKAIDKLNDTLTPPKE